MMGNKIFMLSDMFSLSRLITSGGFRGVLPARAPPPPRGPKFSQFHAVFCKIWQNHMLTPPGGLAPPPTGNPRSAPDNL